MSKRPLTDQMVTDAESTLNVRLPAFYVEALRQRNGGSTIGQYIRLSAQDIPEHLEGFVDHGFVSIGGLNALEPATNALREHHIWRTNGFTNRTGIARWRWPYLDCL